MERDKDRQSGLFEQSEKVQKDLVLRSLRLINDGQFQVEVVQLFEASFKTVEEMLRAQRFEA